jgi:6-pyruvoyltetrahydropterin/6-carboxytetrahydropterin synthase
MSRKGLEERQTVVHLTRRYWFSASHRLHNPALADADNVALYGKCNNPGGHGHNYHLEVTVAGPVDQRTGMVLDLAELDGFIIGRILERFDQSNLNDQDNFANHVPTTENLCLEIHRIVSQGWRDIPSARGASLERVRLEETSSNFFEVTGVAPHSASLLGS